jgi:hypothetical protein
MNHVKTVPTDTLVVSYVDYESGNAFLIGSSSRSAAALKKRMQHPAAAAAPQT